MKRREWVRRMTVAAVCLLVLGLALLIVGSVVAGTHSSSPMGGVGIGMLGTLLLAGGGLCAKFAIAGPFPDNLEA